MPDAVFRRAVRERRSQARARFYMIPIIIHESDSVPGLTNKLSAKFAKRIGIGFEGGTNYFDKNKTFVSGNPAREELVGEGVNRTRAENRSSSFGAVRRVRRA